MLPTILTLLLAWPVFLQAQLQPQVSYGEDDRLDLCQVEDENILKLADSTVALFESADLIPDPPNKQFGLGTEPLGKSKGLCPEERFYDQEAGATCSGFLVAPDLVMTAGHCLMSITCARTRFVFGFAIRKDGGSPKTAPTSEVYSCAKILDSRFARKRKDPDWALVKLDRPVEGHAPLALDKTGKIVEGTPLFIIGYPTGLPAKVSGGATVIDASFRDYFIADLDTYDGNSGSPVFSAQTRLVVGILSSGEKDFVSKGACKVTHRCPQNGGKKDCEGEIVTKISSTLPRHPKRSGAAVKRIPTPEILEKSQKANFD